MLFASAFSELPVGSTSDSVASICKTHSPGSRSEGAASGAGLGAPRGLSRLAHAFSFRFADDPAFAFEAEALKALLELNRSGFDGDLGTEGVGWRIDHVQPLLIRAWTAKGIGGGRYC